MSDKLEHTFKKSLEDFEVPYSAEAWAAMNARLDAASPGPGASSGGGGLRSLLKWIAASVVVAGGITAALLLNRPEKDQKLAQETPSELRKDVRTQNADRGNDQSGINRAVSGSDNISSEINNPESPEGNHSPAQTGQAPDQSTQGSHLRADDNSSGKAAGNGTEEVTPGNVKQNPEERDDNDSPESSEPGNSTKPLVPTLGPICLGQSWTVKNPNKTTLVLLAPNGKTYAITAGSEKTIKPQLGGEYLLGYFDGSSYMAETSANVKESKPIDFLVDDADPYDNGVPTIYFSAGSAPGGLTWHFENRGQKQSGNAAEVHYFKKGTYTATLEAKDGNGCLARSTKEITVKEDFNLLAPEGFDPNDPDPRNNTFMPVSLQLRDAAFELTIFDPKNGGILFQTSDASQGWDGTDRRTGKTVSVNQVYFWKVVLKNPMEGESQVYTGNITVTNR